MAGTTGLWNHLDASVGKDTAKPDDLHLITGTYIAAAEEKPLWKVVL